MNNTTRVLIRGMGSIKRSQFLTDEVVLYIYAATLIVGIIGNFLVLFSIASRRRSRRRLSANEVFILNLALSDLLLLLIFIPYAIYIRLANFRPTVFVCKCTAPIITVALGGIIYTLAAMAVQRCLVITQPFRQECTVKRAIIIIAVIWVFSFALSIPKILVATPWPQRNMCIFPMTRSQEKTYAVTLFVLRFAIPFCLIIISYIKMGMALLKTQAPRFAADSSGNIRDVTNRKESIEVIKTLVIISFLFFVLMLPYRVTRLMIMFGYDDSITRNIYKLTATLTIAHSCINPIIYGTFMKKFGQDYKRFFINLFCCRFSSSQEEAAATTDDGCEREIEHVRATSFKWKKVSQKQQDKSFNETLESHMSKHKGEEPGDLYLLSDD